MAEASGVKIGFECDGKDFHDESRDEWRDAMILGSKGVDAIYRMRGADLYYHINDILYFISKWDPELFSQRGLLNLEVLASDAVRTSSEEYTKCVAFIRYQDDDYQVPIDITVRKLFIDINGGRRFLETAYDFACSIGGGNLDYVIGKYQARNKDGKPDWDSGDSGKLCK
ncbi:hypothetical protein E4633_17105 [Geomonas terrae]|uniref:Uncharacterized protein n=2 Tax=Geomonas terrae TaxID=2562681 RepID=A0A4S1CCL9_9BACT|nr:hypothetical protein E4633_17105 [Geomonas terrae]